MAIRRVQPVARLSQFFTLNAIYGAGRMKSSSSSMFAAAKRMERRQAQKKKTSHPTAQVSETAIWRRLYSPIYRRNRRLNLAAAQQPEKLRQAHDRQDEAIAMQDE